MASPAARSFSCSAGTFFDVNALSSPTLAVSLAVICSSDRNCASVGADDSVSVGGNRTETIDHNRTVTVGKAGAAASRVDVTGKHDVTATEYIQLEVKGTFIRIDEKSITLQVKSGGKIVIDTKVLAQAKEEAKRLFKAEFGDEPTP